MNKKNLGIFVCTLAVFMLATPMVGTVMAIGPLKALEVGKNPKATGIVPLGIVMLDDVGPNNIAWINLEGMIMNMADARKGKGRMNTAIIADHATVVAMQADDSLYENKWVYFSGTGQPQYDDPLDDTGSHGMLY